MVALIKFFLLCQLYKFSYDIMDKYGKLYALFVDLRRAFDSINHIKLWRKLYKIGVSSKLICILRDLYSKANMKVRTTDGPTRNFKISQGV